jgi:hypothetical protein
MPQRLGQGDAALCIFQTLAVPQIDATFPHVQIGVADPGGKDVENDFATFWHKVVAILSDKWLSKMSYTLAMHGPVLL